MKVNQARVTAARGSRNGPRTTGFALQRYLSGRAAARRVVAATARPGRRGGGAARRVVASARPPGGAAPPRSPVRPRRAPRRAPRPGRRPPDAASSYVSRRELFITRPFPARPRTPPPPTPRIAIRNERRARKSKRGASLVGAPLPPWTKIESPAATRAGGAGFNLISEFLFSAFDTRPPPHPCHLTAACPVFRVKR